MIGLVSGRCVNGNQAVDACTNPTCIQPALCCQVVSCGCRQVHNECQHNSKFAALLNKIHDKKTIAFNYIQKIKAWYEQLAMFVLECRDNMLQETAKIVDSSLSFFEAKLMSLIREEQQNSILPSLIREVQSSIDDAQYLQKFNSTVETVIEYSSKVVTHRLQRIPADIIRGGVGQPIIINMLGDEKFDLNIDLSSTVGFLKKVISIQKGLLVQSMRLIMGGLQMYDQHPLSMYNIQEGSTIAVIKKLYGE